MSAALTTASPRTGVVLLNMGGPQTLDDVEPFLQRVFADRDIIQLPMQNLLGPWIVRRRVGKVRDLYAGIGGGSPILRWTQMQGHAMSAHLEQIAPEWGPYRHYIAFRYVAPFAEDALQAMAADGIERVVVFTQYPQWSCSTSGSSFNDLWRAVRRGNYSQRFTWSVIDRWHAHPGFVASMAERIREGLAQYPAEERDQVLLLFSAHSIPLNVVDRGDPYPAEVAASTDRIMEALARPNPHLLAWQSDVGPVRWLGPSTEQMLHRLAEQGWRNVLVIPVAFTSDHIETLSELDKEYGDLARSLGITGYRRAPALNDLPTFTEAMATIVAEHLARGERHSPQYLLKCPGCPNSTSCRDTPWG